jgi:hypothetical protein
VVHLLHASSQKVPVTLQISQHDDGEHMKHIVKVRMILVVSLHLRLQFDVFGRLARNVADRDRSLNYVLSLLVQSVRK